MPPRKSLHRRLAGIADDAGAEAVAVSFFDYRHRTAGSYRGERWFHAASTIKVAVLLGVYDAIQQGRFESANRLHVRNRFQSVVDGSPYRIDAGRDANDRVHGARGRTLRIGELAREMIVTSSNLATNLLVELVGIDAVRATLERVGVAGVEFRRGVEDMAAWENGINNRVTADGLAGLLRVIQEGRGFEPELAGEMLEILHDQEFRSGIPAGLPDEARVAHKTGEISTVSHDAGIVYMPDREPWVVVILTEWAEDVGGRRETIARISREIHDDLTDGEGDEDDGGGEGGPGDGS